MKQVILIFWMMTMALSASDIETARERYRKAVAEVYGVALKKITVQPVSVGLPDNPYEPLQTGDLYAVRADWEGADPGAAGFAAADGRVAFAKYSEGVRTLLLACGVRDEKKMLPLKEVIRRLAWVYRGAGEPVEGVEHEHHVERDDAGVTILYYTRHAGETGVIIFKSVTVSLKVDGTCVTRIEKVNAQLP
jgi:hypothetical protein